MVSSSISLDRFLFACFEYESSEKYKLALANHGTGSSILNHELPAEFYKMKTDSIVEMLDILLSWYIQEYPALSSEEPLVNSILPKIVAPIISLTHDYGYIVEKNTHHKVPPFLIAGSSETSVHNDVFWEESAALFRDKLPHANYLFAYFKWHFSKTIGGVTSEQKSSSASQPSDEVNGNSVNYRQPRENNFSKNFGGQHRKPRFHAESKTRFNRRDDQNPFPFRNRDLPPPDPALEHAAIEEVEEAIKRLEANADIPSVALNPLNSFYRRKQHQHAVQLGYTSQSIGEGRSRCVVISRVSDQSQ